MKTKNVLLLLSFVFLISCGENNKKKENAKENYHQLKEGEVSLAKYKDEEKGAFCELIERNNNEVVRIITFPDGSFSEDYYDKRRIDNKEVFFYNKKNKGYDDEFYSYFFIEDEYLVLRLKGMSDKKYKLE